MEVSSLTKRIGLIAEKASQEQEGSHQGHKGVGPSRTNGQSLAVCQLMSEGTWRYPLSVVQTTGPSSCIWELRCWIFCCNSEAVKSLKDP